MSADFEQLKIDFNNILKKYGDTIYYIALMHTKNEMDAQDIVQDVFLKYAQRQEVFESEEHRKAWLIRVTVNMCINLNKSAWATKNTELKEEILPSVKSPEDNNYIQEAVFKLPEKYRMVVHLFYFEGYSIKEISSITGQKENAVKTQLSRARNQLKDILRGEYEYEF